MRSRLSVFALLFACGGSTPPSDSPAQQEDAIVATLRRAAADHVAVADAEAIVGSPAISITTRELDRERFQMADLPPDTLAEDCPAAGDLTTYADAAYWGRGSDDADGNPRVVGLRWRASGEVELFCAVVLPP